MPVRAHVEHVEERKFFDLAACTVSKSYIDRPSTSRRRRRVVLSSEGLPPGRPLTKCHLQCATGGKVELDDLGCVRRQLTKADCLETLSPTYLIAASLFSETIPRRYSPYLVKYE